jgi:DNA adenine methylase
MDKPLKPAFGRVGGKTKLAKKIVSLIPSHETYVELFVGAGAIYLTKPISNKNVVNDVDKNIYDMWRDIRSVEKIDYEFSPSTNATRENFIKYKAQTDIQDPDERLLRNLFLNKNSYCANMIMMGYKDPTKWKTNKLTYLKNNLQNYKYKLNSTDVLNEDYRDVIKKYDKEDTLFYLDPPYSQNHKYWNYACREITKEEIRDELRKIKGKFIFSYNHTPEIEDFFKEFKYEVVDTKHMVKSLGSKDVKELIVFNF